MTRTPSVAFTLLVLLCASSRVGGQDPLPSGEQVMDRFVEACGGKEAYAKVDSIAVAGTVSIRGTNISGPFTVLGKEPGQWIMTADLAGAGQIERGYDPTSNVGWERSDVEGLRLLAGAELEHLRREASLRGESRWRDFFTAAKTTGKEAVNGDDCYKVELTGRSGETETRYYSAKTGLLARTEMTINTPRGAIPVKATLEDYRVVNGIKVPFKTTQELQTGGAKMAQEVTVATIEFNAEIPAEKLAVPDDVKALAAKAKAKADAPASPSTKPN